MSLSQFQVLSDLGVGSYSTVFKVRRILDNEIYAMKKVSLEKLSEKEKKFTLSEIRILASINHPNIISFKEAFFEESENCLCLILEYSDSGDLYQRIQKCIKRRVHLSEKLVWSILIQLTQGLKALHDLNIIHRDLKSANVFLNKDGKVKLGDMNVSKVAKDGFLKTQTGTPYYASPEVWNNVKYSHKSDIWSLGCVIYETLCLKPPFRGMDMDELYNNVLIGKYPNLPKIYSQDIDRVLTLLLNSNASLRPSCDEILDMPEVKKHMNGITLQNTVNQLLLPIKVPSCINKLSLSLPRPNYPNCSEYCLSQAKSESRLPKLKLNIPKNFTSIRNLLDKASDRSSRIKKNYISPIKYCISPQRLKKSEFFRN